MTAALVIVDAQRDFCPGGTLAVPHGDRVVPVLNRYAGQFHTSGLLVIASRDWHPAHSLHFLDRGGPWPVHCVQGAAGAAFHPDLRLPPGAIIVSKGTGPADDGYSAFQGTDASGTPLASLLAAAGVNELFVGGLATDYCVRATILDALGLGLRAWLLIDGSRGVNVQPGDSENAIEEVVRAGADLLTLERLDLGRFVSRGARERSG